MKKLVLMLIVVMTVMTVNARTAEGGSKPTGMEYGVACVKRICPARLWDGLVLANIGYDNATDTVILDISGADINEDLKTGKFKPTETEIHGQLAWFVYNFERAYADLIANPTVLCDGDFMAYLSIGTLIKIMEGAEMNLRIVLSSKDGYRLPLEGRLSKTKYPDPTTIPVNK